MPKPTENKIPANPQCDWLERVLKFYSKKWTARAIYFLSGEPRRFGDLRRDLKGVSAKVLTQRLIALERAGIVNRSELETVPPSVEYSLTKTGRRSLSIINQFQVLKGKLKI